VSIAYHIRSAKLIKPRKQHSTLDSLLQNGVVMFTVLHDVYKALAFSMILVSILLTGCGGMASPAADNTSAQNFVNPADTITSGKATALGSGILEIIGATTKNASLVNIAGDLPGNTLAESEPRPITQPNISGIGGTGARADSSPNSGITLINIPSSDHGTTFYVRVDGGDPTQCNGKTNAPLNGSSMNNCAWAHIGYALPANGTSRIAGGDRLVIANGSYMVGYGMPGSTGCSTAYPYDCKLLPVPSGPSPSLPTRIVGIEYETGCKNKPQLWGTERVTSVLDLNNANNIEIQCLEITDHSNCNSAGTYSDPSLTCRNSPNGYGVYPNGTYGDNGIVASNSRNVLLQNLDIHGMAAYGINAAGLTDWTMNYVRLALNGLGGWGGTYKTYTNMYGTTTLSNMIVEWNGCSDNYPHSDTPYACADQNGGGYGDGIGLDRTGGNFVITDSVFRYNIQDGLDVLYHSEGGTLVVNRVRAEGNVGNQIKIAGNSVVMNSVIVGNCNHISTKTAIPHTSPATGIVACRAGGDTLGIALIDRSSGSNVGATGYIVNNTITGGGNVMILGATVFPVTTNPVLYVSNNIMLGDGPNASAVYPGDSAAYYDATIDLPTLPIILNAQNNIINSTRTSSRCLAGPSNICNSSAYPSTSVVADANPESFNPRLKAGSIAIKAGVKSAASPIDDYFKLTRPQGNSVDIGAVKY
jgi:hypothetical protein